MTGFSVSAVGVEVWLAAGYCVALVGLAYVIDALARHAASVSEGGRSGGFVYHRDHDAWQCPQDQWLWPRSFDSENRVVRYRGTASICNACPVKDSCTTSPSGREIQRSVDSWPASEAARFHRRIACVVVALLLSVPLGSHLRRNPVFIPEGMVQRSLDDAVTERQAAADTPIRRRSSYGSDRREPGPEAAR